MNYLSNDPAEAGPSDWTEWHGAGQRKHGSQIGQGHRNRDDEPAVQYEAEAERALLGSILLKPDVLEDVIRVVGPDDFLDPKDRHGALFSHVIAMHLSGVAVDLVTLVGQLKRADDLERIGGYAYLAELSQVVPHAGNAVYYAKQIKRSRLGRDLTDLGRQMSASNAPELLEEFAKTLAKLTDQATTSDEDRFEVMSDADLMASDCTVEYWIDGVLAKGQEAMLAGVYKTLKTSIAIDLAIALATKGMFLGYFHVLEQATVLFMSSESGKATIKETRGRICRKAGLPDGPIAGLHWSTKLPRPNRPGDMAVLRALLKRYCVQVLILDPAYLMLPGDDVANLFKQGEVLGELAGLCREMGVTLVLIHHGKKTTANQFEPMELHDASMAGFAEFARQWILLSRREKYLPGSGLHRLHLSVGGSAGHSGLWGLDIDEGIGHGNRHWHASLMNSAECRTTEEERRRSSKEEKALAKDEAVLRKILARLVKVPAGETRRWMRDKALGSDSELIRAIALGIDREELEACEIIKGRKPCEAYRIPKSAMEGVA